MNATLVFPLRYGMFRPLLAVLGMGPGVSGVELDGDELRVRMGWAFRARAPRSAITGARAVTGMVGGIGVHGWRSRWLVNGTTTGIVGIDFEPRVRATAVGFPVKMGYLAVSVVDPDALLAGLKA